MYKRSFAMRFVVMAVLVSMGGLVIVASTASAGVEPSPFVEARAKVGTSAMIDGKQYFLRFDVKAATAPL